MAERVEVLREAIAACQRIADRYQREANELGGMRERRTSPLLMRGAAMECVSVLTGMMMGRPACDRCKTEPRWDIFVLCRGCHADWVRECQAEITTADFPHV